MTTARGRSERGATADRELALRVPGCNLCGLTWLEGLLWYSDQGLDEIIAVDRSSGAVVTRFPCPEVRTALTAADGGRSLVQVVGADKRLRAIDPHSGDVLAEYPNPRPGTELCGLQDTPAGFWLGYSDPPMIELRRLADPKPTASFPVEGDVADLTVVGDLVVFGNHPDACLKVLDPAGGGVVDVIRLTGNPTGVAWDGERLWYCDYAAGYLRAVGFDGSDGAAQT